MCQRMLWPDEIADRGFAEGLDRNGRLPLRRSPIGNEKVQLATQQADNQSLDRQDMRLYRRQRCRLPQIRQQFVEQRGEHRPHANAHLSCVSAYHLPDGLLQGRRLPQQRARLFQDRLAGGTGDDTGGIALEQRQPQFPFERLNAPAERGLRYMQPGGGHREGAIVGYADGVTPFPQIHRPHIPIMHSNCN